MLRIIIISIGHLATIISFISLYLTVVPASEPRPSWHILLIAFGSLMSLGIMGSEVFREYRLLPKRYEKQNQINDYMRRWISSGDRAVIFSRDMSWASDDAVTDLLKQKSQNKELTLLVEHATLLTDELQGMGARVLIYGQYNHRPRSRFTIVDYGKEGARIAVGSKNIEGKHEIREFRSGYDPLYAIAEDMVRIIENSAVQ